MPSANAHPAAPDAAADAAADLEPGRLGAPGRLLQQRIDSIASQPVVQVGAKDRLLDAARLMATRRTSCVPVTDGQGRVLGMVSETRLLDVLRGNLDSSDLALSAAEPMLTVDGSLRCDAAWQLCLQRGATHLGVVDAAQRLVGIVSESDFRMLLHLSVLAGRHLVPSVMQPVARLVRPDQTLREAAAVMNMGEDAAVVVVDDSGTPVGVLTARDTTRCLATQADAAALQVSAVMSRPVLHIDTRASLNEAAEQMLAHRVRHLAVMDELGSDGGRLVGLLSGHDLARAMAVGLVDDAFAQDRARHRAILDALPDLVWLKDPDGVYLACNPRFEQLYGAPESQIIGRTDHDFVSAELAAFFRANDRAAMAADAPTSNEELLRFASDGHSELTHTIKSPVRDAQGRLLGVLGIGRDITALRRVEDEYRHVFERNPAPMAVYERATRRLVAVNDAFCALYGWTKDEALQLVVSDLLHPSQHAQADAAVQHNQGLATQEWQHRRRDGTPMQVLAQSHDITRDGLDCRVVVITDISRWHRNQQREQRRLRLLDSLIRGDALALQLEQLALDHEAAFPDSLCSVLLLDATGRLLQHGAAPSLPDFYNQAIHGLEIGPGRGACGSAAHSGQVVVCENLATDPRWVPYLHLAQRAGLGACWSTPIIGAAGQVLGTFAAYRRQPARPEAEELEDATFGAGLAALAITQQQRAQRLRDSERRLADTLHAVPDPIWLTDRDGALLLANAAYQHLVEPSADGAAAPDRRAAEAAAHNRATLAAHLARVAASGEAATAEQALQRPPDGQPALFEVVGTPLRDARGQATGVVGAARDITLMRQGAQALADQLQLLDVMFSQTADAILLIDPQTGRLVTFNDAACRGLGYSRDEFATLTARDIQAELSDSQIASNDARAMAGEAQRFDTRHRHRDGHLLEVSLTLRRIEYGGRPLLSAVWQDVTERRRHADSIRRLNQEDLRLRAMLSLSQRAGGLDEAALWREGIDTLVGLVGGAWGSLQPVDGDSGMPGAAVWSTGTPQPLQALLPLDSGTRALVAICMRALRAGAAVDGALAAGGQRWRALAVPVLDRGRAVLVVCVLRAAAARSEATALPGDTLLVASAPAADAPQAGRTTPDPQSPTQADGPASAAHDLALAGADLWDIVQRRRTEIALAQAKAAADAASQAKSAFLANMSHEIRTPLNAVLGFAHLLQREPLSARQLDHLAKIADASQHLLQVINDILDFSKIEASKVQLDPTDFALQPCLQRMLAMVADKARTSQVLLQLDTGPHCPALVHGDRLRLEQILLNLLSNAVKFSPQGRVTLQVVPLGNGWLRFDVADTGIGIDPAQLPLLFKPFQQADASTTRRFGGTGLGLAISHRLAQLMGGRIGVTSRPGEGSRFRLELPMPAASLPALGAAALPAADVPTSPTHGAHALQGLQVLLAEDNPINQEVALELLSAQGAQVDVADDGEVALQHARAGHYDVVLMDVQMPRMDGLRAAAAIRRLPGWEAVPIIAMTASAFPEDRNDCLAAGMNDVLVKPVRPDALTQTLLRWTRLADASPVQPAAPTAAAAAPPTAAQHVHLQALRRLLQSHDTEAADHLQRHAAQLQAALGDERYAALAADVQGYAFGAALARVDALLAAGAG